MPNTPICSYVFVDRPGEKTPCPHSVYGKHDTCVFHSPDVKNKAKDFHKALKHYREHCESEEAVKFYDFRGFIFPEISLSKTDFLKNADFSDSKFSGSADFSDSKFSGDADFSDSRFSGYASFRSSQFSGDAYFSDSKFSGSAYFSDSKFSGYASFRSSQFSRDAYFISSKFSGYADFRSSKFSGYAYFISSKFSGDADFSDSKFSGSADFSDSKFSGSAYFSDSDFEEKVYFSGAEFHKTLQMDEAYLRLLDQSDKEVKGMSFDGTVIDEANLWGVEKLIGYSFRDSFLLALSLAGRKLIDCDFTGAVIDAVRTRDWQPDAKTLAKTQFIYTDYSTEKVVDAETGQKRTQYKAILDSRVPASGNFGEGEHANFTIKDYLKERFRWSRAINLPVEIRTAVLNYIQFFSDFIRLTEGLEVFILAKPEGNKIRVEFQTDSKADKDRVEERFQDYMTQAQSKDLEDLKVRFSENSKASPGEKELLEAQFRHQISGLQLNLTSVTQLLESEKDKVRILESSQATLKEFIGKWEANPRQLLEAPPLVPKKQCRFFAIAKADIKSFSAFMKQGKGTELSEAFEKIVKHNTQKLKHAQVKEGDSIQLIGENAADVIKAAKRIMEDLGELDGNPQLRVALHMGEVDCLESLESLESSESSERLESTEASKGFKIRGGNGLRTVARLEPLVTPGEIWCTEAFRTMMEEQGCSPLPQRLEGPQENIGTPKEGQYNIAKPDEDDEWKSLFRI